MLIIRLTDMIRLMVYQLLDWVIWPVWEFIRRQTNDMLITRLNDMISLEVCSRSDWCCAGHQIEWYDKIDWFDQCRSSLKIRLMMYQSSDWVVWSVWEFTQRQTNDVLITRLSDVISLGACSRPDWCYADHQIEWYDQSVNLLRNRLTLCWLLDWVTSSVWEFIWKQIVDVMTTWLSSVISLRVKLKIRLTVCQASGLVVRSAWKFTRD